MSRRDQIGIGFNGAVICFGAECITLKSASKIFPIPRMYLTALDAEMPRRSPGDDFVVGRDRFASHMIVRRHLTSISASYSRRASMTAL